MTLDVEPGDGILRFVFRGATPARDVYAVFHAQFAAASPATQVLIDLSGSTSLADRTPEFVRMLTEFVLGHPKRPGDRMAVVLPPSEMPRWSGLADQLNATGRAELRLFEQDEAASAWLTEDRD